MTTAETLAALRLELNTCLRYKVASIRPIKAVPASATWRMMKSGRHGWTMYGTASRDYLQHDTLGALLITASPVHP